MNGGIRMKFYLVDTFSSAAITRQPSCVVLIDQDAPMPSDEVMASHVDQLGYSDIVFMKRETETSFLSRYFSKGETVPFKINSTIAAYTVLYNEAFIEKDGVWTEDTGSSMLNIKITDGFIHVETQSADQLTKDLDIKDESHLLATIGVQSEQISKKPTADYFKKTFPGIFAKMLPEVKTPVMNLNTLMALFQEATMAEDIKKSVAGTPLEAIVSSELFDPIATFMNEAFDGSDEFSKKMIQGDSDHEDKVLAIASPMLPQASTNILEHLNLMKDKSSNSFGRIIKDKANDNIQFYGYGTVMAEGTIVI